MAKGNWEGTKVESIPKRHLFLYEYVPAGADIFIYGLGKLGTSYIQQIEATGYCNIVAISDKDKEKGRLFGYEFICYEDILPDNKADYYVVAIDDRCIASSIYWDFLNRGIEKERILSIYLRENLYPIPMEEIKRNYTDIRKKEDDNSNIYVAIIIRGGIGDNIISLSFCRRLESLCENLVVDIYSYQQMMQDIWDDQKIRDVFYNKEVIEDKYDIVFSLRQLIHVPYINRDKISRLSPKIMSLIQKTVARRKADGLEDEDNSKDLMILKRAAMLGCNRYEMLGDQNIWDLVPEMSRIDINPEYGDDFEKLELNTYMTFGMGSARIDGHAQTKEWKSVNYGCLVQLLKSMFPNISVVQIEEADVRRIRGVDRFFAGESLELIKYILKNSLLYIGFEGAMAHLATQLGTKCIVLFGPTPIEYYGYPQNINLCAGDCHGCMGIAADWYTKCPLYEEPKCMEAITPEMVADAVWDFLNDKKEDN